jgi:transposase-like protein
MFNTGDKYIHFTKYGGVNKGEVELYGSQINWDTENMVAYHVPYIKTTVGHIIYLDGTDGCAYKIKNDITEEMLKKLKNSSTIFEDIKNRKEEHKKKTFAIFEQRAAEAREMLKNSNAEEVLKKYKNERK